MQRKIIWFGIVFSTVVYAIIAYTTAPQPQRSFEQSVRQPLTLILYVAALSAFIMGVVIPNLSQNRPAQVRMIVGLAIFEACSIFGLMAAFLNHDWRLYLPAWALSLIGFMRVWPSEEVSVPGSSRR